jgi:hypothetical protein
MVFSHSIPSVLVERQSGPSAPSPPILTFSHVKKFLK